MITCFIRTEFLTFGQNLTVVFFLLIPFSFIFYSIYVATSLCCNTKIRNNPRLKSLYLKYLVYISVYLVVNIPMFSLYIISIYMKIQPGTFLGWLSFTSCVLAVAAQPLLCIVRLIQGYIKLDFCSLCCNCKKKKTQISNLSIARNETLLDKTFDGSGDEFRWLESNAIKTVSVVIILVYKGNLYWVMLLSY
jgi:hypothetical protein